MRTIVILGNGFDIDWTVKPKIHRLIDTTIIKHTFLPPATPMARILYTNIYFISLSNKNRG